MIHKFDQDLFHKEVNLFRSCRVVVCMQAKPEAKLILKDGRYYSPQIGICLYVCRLADGKPQAWLGENPITLQYDTDMGFIYQFSGDYAEDSSYLVKPMYGYIDAYDLGEARNLGLAKALSRPLKDIPEEIQRHPQEVPVRKIIDILCSHPEIYDISENHPCFTETIELPMGWNVKEENNDGPVMAENIPKWQETNYAGAFVYFADLLDHPNFWDSDEEE